MVTAVVIGGVLLLCMIAAAVYAIRVLPAGARVPLNAGVPEYSVWLSRPAGLAAWLGVGVAAYAVFAALTVSLGGNWVGSVRAVLLPCVMLVVLAAETGAVITARKRAGADRAAPPEQSVPSEQAAPAEHPAPAGQAVSADQPAPASEE